MINRKKYSATYRTYYREVDKINKQEQYQAIVFSVNKEQPNVSFKKEGDWHIGTINVNGTNIEVKRTIAKDGTIIQVINGQVEYYTASGLKIAVDDNSKKIVYEYKGERAGNTYAIESSQNYPYTSEYAKKVLNENFGTDSKALQYFHYENPDSCYINETITKEQYDALSSFKSYYTISGDKYKRIGNSEIKNTKFNSLSYSDQVIAHQGEDKGHQMDYGLFNVKDRGIPEVFAPTTIKNVKVKPNTGGHGFTVTFEFLDKDGNIIQVETGHLTEINKDLIEAEKKGLDLSGLTWIGNGKEFLGKMSEPHVHQVFYKIDKNGKQNLPRKEYAKVIQGLLT